MTLMPGPAAAPWLLPEPALEAVLAEYEARQSEEALLLASWSEEEAARRRDELLICVGRATGLLLNLLIRESGARSILELGTAYGYSTLWLAEAARATGGRVLSIDVVPGKQQRAAALLDRAALRPFVEFRCQDALDFLDATSDTYDFVLLDLWKDAYIPAIDRLLDHLEPGATIVVDNMTAPAAVRFAAARFLKHVHGIAALQVILLPVGSGLAVCRYQGPTMARPRVREVTVRP